MANRTGRYVKANPKGRAWHVLVNGNERPVTGEVIDIIRRDSKIDNVAIVVAESGGPGAWRCTFRRINEPDTPSAPVINAGDYLNGSATPTLRADTVAEDEMDSEPNDPQVEQTSVNAGTDPRIAALQALLGGVDERKIMAQVNGRVDATLRPVVDRVNTKVQEIMGTAARAEGLLSSVPETVRRVALEVLAQAQRVEVVVTTQAPNAEPVSVNMGQQHNAFPQLLTYLQTGMNVWLAGPAGTGKTTAARMAAEALGRPFYFNGAIDTEYKLSGFIDAQGRVVGTAFRKAWTEGGVYLFDECDASLPPALLAFNAALANSHADFPDGVVERHPNFLCIAAANTWGLGADFEYVGRNKLDAAFLDRFVFLSWNIDERLEDTLAANRQWVQRVRQVRSNAKAKGVKAVISPRASIFGAKLLAANVSWDEVETVTLRKGLNEVQWGQIK